VRVLTALVLLSAFRAPLSAQAPQRTAEIGQPTADSLSVYLITIGQGAQYWEKYGHNMLWFHSPSQGIDEAYNWGTFDFDQPGFIKRQLVGDPQYSVEAVPSSAVFAHYRAADRTITLQRLNLTQEQARRALERSRFNARPENKYYRYDYYLDNCSTRVRDMIDYALGGALRAAAVERGDWTYRRETVRLLDDLKPAQFGVQWALGQPADRRLIVWEDMFIPMRMRDALRWLKVPGSDSTLVPVVAEERELYRSTRYEDRQDMPRLEVPYFVVGLILAGGTLLVLLLASRWRFFDRLLRIQLMLWGLVTGVMGLLLLVAWLYTRHVFWYRNENLLLFNPLALALVVLMPLSLRNDRWLRPAAICAVLLAMCAALALALKGFSASQDNLPLVLMMLPAHFAVAFALRRRVATTSAARAAQK
jgi:hypothetical protein